MARRFRWFSQSVCVHVVIPFSVGVKRRCVGRAKTAYCLRHWLFSPLRFLQNVKRQLSDMYKIFSHGDIARKKYCFVCIKSRRKRFSVPKGLWTPVEGTLSNSMCFPFEFQSLFLRVNLPTSCEASARFSQTALCDILISRFRYRESVLFLLTF